MSGNSYQEFVQLLDNRAGDTFRSAWTYDDDDWHSLYVREDIATDDLRRTISTLIQRAREHEPIIPPNIYGKMGEVEATIELHTDAVFLHFWAGESDGVIVTLDKDAAQDLTGFVEQCFSVLNES